MVVQSVTCVRGRFSLEGLSLLICGSPGKLRMRPKAVYSNDTRDALSADLSYWS